MPVGYDVNYDVDVCCGLCCEWEYGAECECPCAIDMVHMTSPRNNLEDGIQLLNSSELGLSSTHPPLEWDVPLHVSPRMVDDYAVFG